MDHIYEVRFVILGDCIMTMMALSAGTVELVISFCLFKMSFPSCSDKFIEDFRRHNITKLVVVICNFVKPSYFGCDPIIFFTKRRCRGTYTKVNA